MNDNTIYINKEKYLDKVKFLDEPYWNSTYESRWEYISKVVDEVTVINPKKSLEIGTGGIQILETSDSIDKDIKKIDNTSVGKKFLFDCQSLPWPFENKAYDVVIALQVLEHLSPNQRNIFNEIKRISNYAIISLPYKWNCENKNDCHHMIDYAKINEWTGIMIPYKTDVVEGKRNRIILCYKFKNTDI